MVTVLMRLGLKQSPLNRMSGGSSGRAAATLLICEPPTAECV